MPEFNNVNGVSYVYADLGDYDQRCHHYGAAFLFGERLKGLMCPLPGESPRFLQQYIYDTEHELENRMWHFSGLDNSDLDLEIVQEIDIHEFKIRLYNGDGARGYELPASNTLVAIVYDSELASSTKFDLVIKHRGGLPKRINKLHKSYMSLQFPLLFIYGQPGFYTELKLRQADDSGRERRVTMLAYYAYQLHPRVSEYNLIFRRDVSTIPGLYDAISRGKRDGFEVGGRIIFLMSFTGGLVEFQKRGLPHCHTLLWVDSASKIQEPEDVDRLISAELPDPQTDPEGYKVISEMMIHGPCGAANMSATCMQGNKCTKEFVWYDDRKSWLLHQNSKSTVGRLAYVHPTLSELFYFRMMLYHQKGCRDFPEDIMMQEACASAMSSQLKFVFAHILTHYEVTNPLKLWTKYWQEMSHDILGKVSEMDNIPNYYLSDDSLQGYILYEIEIIINNCGKSLQHFGLGPPPPGLLDMLAKRLLIEERNYYEKELQQQKAELVLKLNAAQRKDAAPMNDRRCFEAIDRSLRDILTMPHRLFRGKYILLGEDFWQTLPQTLQEIFTPHKGKHMRLSPRPDKPEKHLFAMQLKWLLDIEDGKTSELDQQDPENTFWIDIPLTYCLPDNEQGLSKLIDFIYDQNTLRTPSAMVQGKTMTYLSHDEATPLELDEAETEMLYPIRFSSTSTRT
ncbi:DNA helicase [Tanacetum coccineum]